MADNNQDDTTTTPADTAAPAQSAPAPAPVPPQAGSNAPIDMTMKQPAGVPHAKERPHMLAIVIGGVVILVALGLGGLYLWGAVLDRQQSEDEALNGDALPATGDQEHIPAVAAPNDELSTLEADLESTDVAAMEAELDALDAEIESGMEAHN